MSNREAVYRARKPYFFQGPPPNSSGQEGDFAISKDIKGLSLYVKYLKKWQRVSGLESQTQKGQGKYIGAEKKTFKSLETDEVVSKKNIKARNIVSSYNHRETKNSTTRGVDVDVTQLNATASGQEVNSIGIDVDVDTSTPTNIGMTTTTGLDVYAKGSAAGGSNAYGMTVKVDGADTNTGIYMNIDDGGRDIRMVSSADTGDYCTIATGANGATTIATIDDDAAAANFTLDIDGDIILDSDNGSVDIKDGGSTRYSFDTDRFRMLNSTLFGNYIEITSQGPGKTIATNDVAAAAAHLTIDTDGDITLDAATGNIICLSDGSTYTPTASNHVADKGYVDGTRKWHFNTGSRWYTRYDNWYFPSVAYGINSVNWNSSLSSAILPIAWNDAYNPCIVVPEDCKINSYHFYGNFTSSQTYQVALMKGSPSYGSAGNTTLSQIGATQELAATASIYNKLEQTGLSVSLSAGDIIIPCLRRTTTDTSTYYYFEFAMNIVGTLSP